MPGSILVSVLGVEDLPSSSRASSSLLSEPSAGGLFSLKLVMGKTEYQTADKGDFSFPVRSIRDCLKLILFDSGDNEISRSDVRVMEVVEKRSWDFLFHLEGGGHIHLKLRFTLNAEEHRRINEMREDVLKRKRAELLKSVSMDRASDFIDREKLFMFSSSQKVQQLPDFHSELDAVQPERQPEAYSKGDSPISEKIITFSPSQGIQQIPDFHSKIQAQQPENIPKEDLTLGENIFTVLPSQKVQQLSDFRSEIDSQQSASCPEVDTQQADNLSKEDSRIRETIINPSPSQEIQQLPDFHSVIDARLLESHPAADTQQPGNLPKHDSPYRDKIITVFPSQAGDLPNEDSPFREKIVTFLPSQEISQLPDHHTEIDAQQPVLPEEDSGRDAYQLNTQRSGHPFVVDSQIKDHPQDVDAEKGENHIMFESVNHSEEKKEALLNPSTQIEEAIDPPMEEASRSPEMVQEIAESSSLMGRDCEKSPASGVKKMISTFESISSKEPRSWMRRVDRADSTRVPWQERLSTEQAKSGGALSKSLSTGSISSFKLRKLNLNQINAQEEEKHCDVATNEKTLKNKQRFPEPEYHQNFPSVESFCRGKNDSLEAIQTKEVLVFCSTVDATEDVKKLSSPEAKECTLEKTLILIDNKENKMAERDYLQSPDRAENISREIVLGPEKKEDPCSSTFHPDQQDSIFGRVTELKSNPKVEFLAYFDAEQCFVGGYGNRIPRHLCITSGSKQLRDAVGCFSYL